MSGTRSFLRLLLCTLAVCTCARPQDAIDPAKAREIERAISIEMSKQNIPGLSAALVLGKHVRWADGFGIADLENGVPVKTATVFRLASVSKPITAVAVMQLVEQGKMELNAPIQKYVPQFPRKQWPVTIRQLLAHQGGVRHYRSDSEINSTRHYTDLIEPLKLFRDDPLVFEPGTHYLYTTYGYCLLGAAVEAASGVKFAEYLRQRIFVPAGMRRVQPDDVYEIIPNRARGYRKAPAGGLRNCPLADMSNKIPGGGLRGTAEDLVEFAVHVNGGTLLRPETVEQMYTRQKTRTGAPTPFGLGWQLWDADGVRWVGHVGSQPGAQSILLILPKEGFAVALLANLEGAVLERLAIQIAGIALR